VIRPEVRWQASFLLKPKSGLRSGFAPCSNAARYVSFSMIAP
jgi:hypothetical protein